MQVKKNLKKLGFSFIIPHRESESIENTINEIKKSCKKANISYEIIATSGNNPSLQRNISVKKAKKENIYFLDNDSKINETSLKKAAEILQNQEVTVLGGPSLLLKPFNFFELCAQETLSNKAVVGKIASRYSMVGEKRHTNDLEIILCNLIIRRKEFESISGFNSKLYPNEENDLISRLLKENKKVYYTPEVYIERNQRKNLNNFIKQMLGYGIGRAEQIKINTKKNYSPFIFALALIISTGLFFFNTSLLLTIISNGIFLYAIYLAFVFTKASVKNQKMLWYLPLTIFSCHFFYTSGFFLGLLKRKLRSEEKESYYKLKIIK